MRAQSERFTLLFTSILCGFFPKIEVSEKQKFEIIKQVRRVVMNLSGLLFCHYAVE